jgi:hypothetical protein
MSQLDPKIQVYLFQIINYVFWWNCIKEWIYRIKYITGLWKIMTFKKKMLNSKIFITTYTERGIVICEEIRAVILVCPIRHRRRTVWSQRFDRDRDGDTSRDGLWKRNDMIVKTLWHYDENATVKWCNCDFNIVTLHFHHLTIVFSSSYHRVFTIVPSRFHQRIIAFSPSCHHVFTIVPSRSHHHCFINNVCLFIILNRTLSIFVFVRSRKITKRNR